MPKLPVTIIVHAFCIIILGTIAVQTLWLFGLMIRTTLFFDEDKSYENNQD